MRQLLAVVVVMLPCYAQAMDNGQYEGVDPATRSWFKSVRSPNGVPCCDIADGHKTEFKTDAQGHYFVPIEGEWHLVPPEAVITSQGNPNDTAIVWYVKQGTGWFVRCFVPTSGV
jgi:hypothetical protein